MSTTSRTKKMKPGRDLDDVLTGLVRRINAFVYEKSQLIKCFAAVLFVVGLVISGQKVDIELASISTAHLAVLVVCLVPLTLSIASFSYIASGKAVGVYISFWDGVFISALGTIAEIFPGPGGAVVRGASLVGRGASVAKSGGIVTVGAILMLSIAFTIGSAPLVIMETGIGGLFLGFGILGVGSCVFWLLKRVSFQLVGAMLLLRITGLVVSAFRIWASFQILGVMVNPIDAALFLIAMTVGLAVSIVPAGVGVSELLGAALGGLVSVSPGAAFIAIALNRVVGLAFCGVLAAVLSKTQLISKLAK